MQSNSIATNPIQIINQQIIEDHQQTEEQLKKELELLKTQRTNVFFKPISDNINIKKTSEFKVKFKFKVNKNFDEKLEVAKPPELKKIFKKQLNNLLKIDVFYCQGRHVEAINNLISRVKNTSIDLNIDNRFKNINYWLHKLIVLLEDFKYIHNKFPSKQIISIEAIAVRLDECLVNLNQCWDGIGSRLAHEYEILNSIKQGLTGKIYLIRKDLYQTAISKFMTSLKNEKNYRIDEVYEVHIYNKLHNIMAEKLGFAFIVDFFMPATFPQGLVSEFSDLAIIDISPAKITSRLAEQMYDKLSNLLESIGLQDWLTTNKNGTDLSTNFDTLETLFFAPINTLFNVANEQKLIFNSIIDAVDLNEELEYSLCRSKEKLHYWIANALMPNTQKVLVANIYDQQTQKYLSIASIDYMFFWVFEQHKYEDDIMECSFEADNHITLNLSHLQQLDFINFTGINKNKHLSLFEHPKKTEVSISLIIQALEQTNNAIIITNFFTNSEILIKFNDLPLLKKKAYQIIFNKLSNKSFKQKFIDEIKNQYFIEKKSVLTKNEANFFMKFNILDEIKNSLVSKTILEYMSIIYNYIFN